MRAKPTQLSRGDAFLAQALARGKAQGQEACLGRPCSWSRESKRRKEVGAGVPVGFSPKAPGRRGPHEGDEKAQTVK